MSKPKRAQPLVVVGILLQFLGTLVLTFALPASFSYYSGSKAIVWVFIGAIVLLTGLIVLLVGVSRAVGGIDYLVSVSADPVSGVEGRAQEGKLLASQE